MELKEISQKIVDATMEIIDNRNINIMDRHGFIIASGDKQRINTYHKGADDVIKSNKVVEIYPKKIENYPGAKEGVNMPINIQGKVVGVVGVQGHPDEVRIVAKLVKISVELALEQHLISEQIKLVKDLKQQIIRKIIYENITQKEEEILCLSKVAGINLNIERFSIIIELKDIVDGNSAQNFKIMSQIEKYLTNSEFILEDDISGSINKSYIIFKQLSLKNYKNEQEYMEKLSRKIYEKCGIEVRIVAGGFYESIEGLKKSFNEAKELLRISSSSIVNINDLNVQTSYLLNQIDQSVLEHFIKPIYDKILDEKGRVQIWIINTLKALFQNDLNINEAAKALYLHKNSLLYRIKKIEKITGLSVTANFNHCVLLRLLIIYAKI